MRHTAFATGGLQLVSYLFIDAGCLREFQKAVSRRYLNQDSGVVVDLPTIRVGHQKAFYYDAVAAQGHGERLADWESKIAERMLEIKRIRALDGYHVPLGDLRGRDKAQRQKKVDVLICVDMLMHTVRRNMDRCTLLAGDVDFQPLIEALVREGMSVTLWAPVHASDDLTEAADQVIPLTVSGVGDALRLESDGSRLIPPIKNDVRPRSSGHLRARWQSREFGYDIHRDGDRWLIERFDPSASATSVQMRSTNLRFLLAAFEDIHAEKLDEEAWALLSENSPVSAA